jgi:hypothetical protein
MKNNIAICAVLSILVMPLSTFSMRWDTKKTSVQKLHDLQYYLDQAEKRGEKKSYWELLKQSFSNSLVGGLVGAFFQVFNPYHAEYQYVNRGELMTPKYPGVYETHSLMFRTPWLQEKTIPKIVLTGAALGAASSLYNQYRAATPGWKEQLNILKKRIDLSGPVVEVDGKTYLVSKKFNNTNNINNPKMRKNQIYLMPTDEHLGDVFDTIINQWSGQVIVQQETGPEDIEAVIVRAAPGVPSTGWRFINKRILPRIIVQVKEGKIWPVLKQLVGHFTPQHPHRSPYGEGIGSKPTHSASSDDIDLIFVDSEHITGPKD